MSEGKPSKALQEFLSEAQEIAEAFSANLMLIDRGLRIGEPDPELVNDIFRGIHTLKSLSAMFGVLPLARLTHNEENLLDAIRLGKVPLDAETLDLLFESVDVILRVLATVSEAGDASAADETESVDRLIARFDGGESLVKAGGGSGDPASWLGLEVLEVLTEYEEHRLRTNLARGMPLYFIRSQFELDTIDVDLDQIKKRLKPAGEIITYLPASDEGAPDKLGINIILALHIHPSELPGLLEGFPATVEEIHRREVLSDGDEDASQARDEFVEGRLSLAVRPRNSARVVSAKAGEQALSLKSVSQTVRVDIRKLDKLMNVVGELAILRNSISRMSEELRAFVGRRELAIEFHRINRGFERRLAELREGILEVRMVSLGQMFDRLSRIVRKVSRELGKEVHFVISGAETEVDKLIIEELSDPLMHIIRNAIDHGIEAAEQRGAAGKPDVGTVALTAYQKGNHVVIEVEDDGAGISGAKLVKAAVTRGLVDDEVAANLSPREILNLVFLPGLSTSEKTTEISGRGVGMDVVKTNIGTVGGVVEVQSELGTGSKFTITLPVTLAIIPALLVVVAGATYAVPLNTVAEALMIAPADVKFVLGFEAITLRGQTLPLCRLDAFFGIGRNGLIPVNSRVVVAAIGQRRLGLVVDALIGQQDVVIKPLGETLNEAHCFSGATDIGDEQLSLVLDTGAVIEEVFRLGEGKEHRPLMMEWT